MIKIFVKLLDDHIGHNFSWTYEGRKYHASVNLLEIAHYCQQGTPILLKDGWRLENSKRYYKKWIFFTIETREWCVIKNHLWNNKIILKGKNNGKQKS